MTPVRTSKCFFVTNKLLKVAVILIGFSVYSESSSVTLKPVHLSDPFISDTRAVTQPSGAPFTATVFSITCTVGLQEQNSGNDVWCIAVNFATDTGKILLPSSRIICAPTADTDVTIGEEYIAGNLGHSIRCKAEVYHQNDPNHEITETSYSPYYWFGLQPMSDTHDFSSSDPVIITESETLTLWFVATFPVTTRACYVNYDQPCQPLYTFTMSGGTQDGSYGLDICSFTLSAIDYNYKKTSNTVLSPFNTIGSRLAPFAVTLTFLQQPTDSVPGSVFENYIVDPITILIDDNKVRPICSSTGVSNLNPFSFSRYDTDDSPTVAEFYLLKLGDDATTKRTLEIQVRRRSCNSLQTTVCNCGLVIREMNNVVGVNGCDYADAVPLVIRYLSPDAPNEPVASIITISSTHWKIAMPSGIEVSVDYFLLSDGLNTNEGLNINVYGLSEEVYTGLCSTDKANYINYAVPQTASLFQNSAECVNEAYTSASCSCEKEPDNTIVMKCDSDDGITTAVVPSGSASCGLSGKRRKRSPDNDVIEVDSSIIYTTKAANLPSTTPAPAVWPTPVNGITEMQANETCQNAMKDAPTYDECTNISSLDLSSYLKTCIRDIQVTDSLNSSLIYKKIVDTVCNYQAKADSSYESSSSTISIPPGQQHTLNNVQSKTCPGQCAPDGEKRGTCNNGVCTCDAGFSETDCSINLNKGATITRLLPACYDYQKLSQSQGLMTILVQGKNIARMGQLICKATMITNDWGRNVSLEQQYPTKFSSGALAAFFRIPNLQFGVLYGVSVSISNDDAMYSNSVLYRMYDGSCMTCDQTTMGCRLLVGYTWLDDYCYGTVDQSCQSNGFVKYDKTYSTGSVRNSQSVTLQDCMSSCCADQDCTAIDFDSVSSECRKHTQKTQNVINTRKSSPYYKQYLIYRNRNEGYQSDAFSDTVDPATCAYDTCGNGGSCYDDGQGNVTCECTAGYSGATCDVDIDDCNPNPCQHGGTCTDEVNGHTCTCTTTYTGTNCESDTNYSSCTPDACANGGTCEEGMNSYTCICAPGYTGFSCGDNIDDCSPNPCQHGGTCTDGVNGHTCTCTTSYTGTNCESAINYCIPNPCSNGGTCQGGVNSYTCACSPGYTGFNCGDNIDDCNPNPCQHGGTCTDGVNSHTCTCTTSYTGTNCESATTCLMKDCSTCVPGSPPKCTQCRPGYGTPTSTDQSECRKCNYQGGCTQCNYYTQCTQCNSTTLAPLTDSSGACAKCASNCRNCAIYGPGKCDSCMGGYYLQPSYTCSACSVDYCQTCSNSKCTACKSGYWLDSSQPQATCSRCGDNCIFCKANPGQCDPGFCKSGFTYMTDTKSCV